MRSLKSHSSAWPVVALVAAFACVTGCSSTPDTPEEQREAAREDLRDYVAETVKDPERRQKALSHLDQVTASLEARIADLKAFRAKNSKALADYDVTQESLLASYDAHVKARTETRKKLLDLHFKLREVLTDKEWPGYAKKQKALLFAYLKMPKTGAEAGVKAKEG